MKFQNSRVDSNKERIRQICDRIFYSKEFQKHLNSQLNNFANQLQVFYYQELQHLVIDTINKQEESAYIYQPKSKSFVLKKQENSNNNSNNNSFSNNYSGSENHNIFQKPLENTQIKNYIENFISKITHKKHYKN